MWSAANPIRIPGYLWIVVALVLLVRVCLVLFMGITPQDAYYHMYSRFPDWSYFDHPPMVAYMLMPLNMIFGDSVFAIKATDLIVSLCTIGLIYKLASKFYPGADSWILTLTIGISLMFTLCSTNTTPDIPLLFFWSLSMLLAHKAVSDGSSLVWALTGISMGLAFDSKYTGLMLPAGLFLFILLSPAHRKLIFSKESLVFILFFLLAVFPVFWWNYQHGWPSFLFQTVDRVKQLNGPVFKPQLFLGTLLTQLAILSPVLLFAIWKHGFQAIYKYVRRGLKPGVEELFLLCFSLPILFFFTGVSFFSWVKINWMYPAYIGGTILIFKHLSGISLRWHIGFAAVVNLLMFVQVVGYLVPVKSDDTWIGWEELSNQVDRLADSTQADFVFSMDSYKTSAVLGFYLKNRSVYAANVLKKNALQFSMWHPDMCFLEGRNALYIDSEPNLDKKYNREKTDSTLGMWFERVDALDPIRVYSSGGELRRRFQVYRCLGYRCSGKPNEQNRMDQ